VLRGALHVAATLALVPYVALALAFALLRDAIAAGSLLAMFLRAVDQFTWLFPWGLIAIVAGLAGVAAMGLVARIRRLGGGCVAAIGTVCLLAILFLPGTAPGAGEIAFLVPCMAATGYGGWLVRVEGELNA
jgi:hypothetical protein